MDQIMQGFGVSMIACMVKALLEPRLHKGPLRVNGRRSDGVNQIRETTLEAKGKGGNLTAGNKGR